MDFLFNIFGYAGLALIVLDLILVSNKKVEPVSFYYQLIAFSGGFLLLINAYYFKVWPFFILNVIYALIAAKTLIFDVPKVKKSVSN
jgi:hypothetical protein